LLKQKSSKTQHSFKQKNYSFVPENLKLTGINQMKTKWDTSTDLR